MSTPLKLDHMAFRCRDAKETVDFYKPTLEQPMGSGPYEIGSYRQGSYVAYKRRADYWAAGLPVNRGRFNFDEIRYEYFRDRTAGLEAFKAGNYDLREEFTAKVWSTEYNIPQVQDGRIKRATLPDDSPSGAQGWFSGAIASTKAGAPAPNSIFTLLMRFSVTETGRGGERHAGALRSVRRSPPLWRGDRFRRRAQGLTHPCP